MVAFWPDQLPHRASKGKTRAYDMAMSDQAQSAFLQVKAHFAGQATIDVGKMLHAPSLRVKGKAFLFATRDVLVMKLQADRIDRLELDGLGQRMTMGKRAMKEWIAIPADDTELCQKLACEARDFVASLHS